MEEQRPLTPRLLQPNRRWTLVPLKSFWGSFPCLRVWGASDSKEMHLTPSVCSGNLYCCLLPGHLLDKCPWQANGEVEMSQVQISVVEQGALNPVGGSRFISWEFPPPPLDLLRNPQGDEVAGMAPP